MKNVFVCLLLGSGMLAAAVSMIAIVGGAATVFLRDPLGPFLLAGASIWFAFWWLPRH